MSTDNGYFDLWMNPWKAAAHFWGGMMRSVADFSDLALDAAKPFQRMQEKNVRENPPAQVFEDAQQVLALNREIAREGFFGALNSMVEYHGEKIRELNSAIWNTWLGLSGEKIDEYWARLAESMENVAVKYPAAIRDIKSSYGFHFESSGYLKMAETERFWLYQVLPIEPAEIRDDAKPIVIRHPYVLGENILAFLPGEKKSLVHCFANNGIPTYVMIVKDINVNSAVQKMTGEDDVLDTVLFCKLVQAIHNRQITLGGLCQGGTMAMLAILTKKLDGIVDRLITAVSPIDGSKSTSLVEYMNKLPESGKDLGYSLIQLPDGEWVVSGEILAAVYKWRRFRTENPISSFYRDISMLEKSNGKIGSTAAAINHWLSRDRKNLPEDIARLALDIYRYPIAEDGTLPVTLFGETLNIRHMNDMPGFCWNLAYAVKDDMVEPASATAPETFLHKSVLEVVPYSGGHVAIATSHPNPASKCSLNACFANQESGEECFGLVFVQTKWSKEPEQKGNVPYLRVV